jgi:hypothetical protein
MKAILLTLFITPLFAAPEVIVYSANPCGISAAITAARQGAEVLLIEPMGHVGGLSTSGINTAENEHMLNWTIGGFAEEFYRRLGTHYGRDSSVYQFESSVAEGVYLTMLKEAGVEVKFGSSVDKVTKSGTGITSITLTDGTEIPGKVFIDASYEGDLMARAKVSYFIGREAKSTYNEEAAGIRFDKTPREARTIDAEGNLLPGISGWAKDFNEGDAHRGVMNYNFRLTAARDPELQVPIPKPKSYDRSRFALLADWFVKNPDSKLNTILDFYPRRNGKFELNNKQSAVISLGYFGGQFDWPDASYEEREKIYQDHLDYTLGLLHFLATDESVPEQVRSQMKATGLHKDEFVDNGNLPYQLYVREGRRMKGAYVMTQKDVQTDRRKDDAIGMSSHFIDCHHVQRLALSETEFINEGRIWRMGYAYQIPYGAIVPKAEECSNLLVPCAASFSHVAYCTLRLESVWMITGQAAGEAAALAASTESSVQEVPVATLQENLRKQVQVVDFIPGNPEKCERLDGPPEF